MAIIDNRLSTTTVSGRILPPADRYLARKILDWEYGGIAIGDPSQGHEVQIWVADIYQDTKIRVYVEPDIEAEECQLIEITDYIVPVDETGNGDEIVEVGLAFDQSMRPAVVYVLRVGSEKYTKLYWFDTFLGGFVTTNFGALLRSPRLLLDDKRILSTEKGLNDMLMFYHRSNALYYRQQRDRFLVERTLFESVPGRDISRIGMNEFFRIQIEWATEE